MQQRAPWILLFGLIGASACSFDLDGLRDRAGSSFGPVMEQSGLTGVPTGADAASGPVPGAPGSDASVPAPGVCEGPALYRDADGDGFGDPEQPATECLSAQGYVEDAGDCDDGCADCFPGNAEICDGQDNDCDDATDELAARVCGVAIGVCKVGTETCVGGSWGACDGGVTAGTEACEGSNDEDCDNAVDEGCACADGNMRACGTSEGACKGGQQVCSGGTWGGCEGATTPTDEVCDDVDNDCDGSTDEGLTRQCGSDIGQCRSGTQACVAGAWGTCEGEQSARAEVCDAAREDEDCDNEQNEGCGCVMGASEPCPGGSDVGACQTGTRRCTAAGTWEACSGQVMGSDETCDGADNDCDGKTDEGVTRPCGTTDLGVCSFGVESCSNGSWSGTCAGEVKPGSAEVCDAQQLDENCNGTSNEGCACTSGQSRACSSGPVAGECTEGTQTCTGGGWTQCMGYVGPTSETCDGKDNDCDGTVDGITRTCGTNRGVCRQGIETCSAGNWSGNCVGEVPPGNEACDASGADEDCDGNTDEGCNCVNGTTRPCAGGTDVGVCSRGTQTCVGGNWATCTGRVDPRASENACDSRDEDCDGVVDEDAGCACDPTAARPCALTNEYCATTDCFTGVCRPRPTSDSNSWDFACGCDGVIYWNSRHAAFRGKSALDVTNNRGANPRGVCDGMNFTTKSCTSSGSGCSTGETCVREYRFNIGTCSASNLDKGFCISRPSGRTCPTCDQTQVRVCSNDSCACFCNAWLASSIQYRESSGCSD